MPIHTPRTALPDQLQVVANGPTEGLNLCVKRVKRAGHGFKCFEHYRLPVLLHAGGVVWPSRRSRLRMGTRCPHSNA